MFESELLEKLYLAEKRSSAEIAKILDCSEHKVNYWLDKFKIPKRTISDAIYLKHNPNGDPFIVRTPASADEAMLWGLGLGLYWGEGNKRNKVSVRLRNTDPRMIRKFIEFLEKLFGINRQKLRFGLQIFSDMKPKEALNFWIKEVKVPISQFQKIIVTPARGIGTYKYKTRHGVLTVYYHNKKLRDIICNAIENI